MLHRFFGQFMKTPRDGFDPNIPDLRIELRVWLHEVAEGIIRGKNNLEFDCLRPNSNYVNMRTLILTRSG